jgi:hypothetical protein
MICDKSVWQQFYQNSKGLQLPSFSHNMFSDQDIHELKDLVKSILINFLEAGELHYGIKVYLNKELQNHWVQDMAERLPTEEESIEDWCKVIFGEKKFGVVFNSLESYSNELTEKMCTIISPLLQEAGLPLGGLSFLFFMGNYGFTPFGIHKEAVGEEGFLFHLGPAEKTFYTWDMEEYNRIAHNTKVFHNVDEMLPSAEPYQLKPRSMMFIPNHVYHIANTDEFSLSIVMDYINPSISKLEQMIAKDIASQVEITPNANYVNPIGQEVNWDNLLDKASWEKRYRSAMEKRIKKLKSNAGVLKPSLLDKRSLFPKDTDHFRGKHVFPLIDHEKGNGRTLILARGHEIEVKSHPDLSQILSKLNGQEKMNMDFLINVMQPAWDHIDIYSFVQELLAVQATEIV